MISINEAQKLIATRAQTKRPARVHVRDALGLVLAQDVTSDVDSPPHDKSMVDGYAVIAAAAAQSEGPLEVVEEVVAGAVPKRSVRAGTATRIMTGAPIPKGADAVVMIEHTELLQRTDGSAERVALLQPDVGTGQHIMRRATSLRRGQTVLHAGAEIRPIEVGLLSEVGCAQVDVIPSPRVAVLATGNELVSAESVPAAGEIRNSNGPMICALVARAGGVPVDLGVARDDKQELCGFIERGLHDDVLVLSGGVSAGTLDLVPSVLSELGVQQVFHKVSVKPGKPVWFGVIEQNHGTTLVFGLPGNPVSSLVCVELFVRPALKRLAGATDAGWKSTSAHLSAGYCHQGNRPTFFPSKIRYGHESPVVQTLDWRGSADLRTLADADCLVHFPAGNREYRAGDEVEVYLL